MADRVEYFMTDKGYEDLLKNEHKSLTGYPARRNVILYFLQDGPLTKYQVRSRTNIEGRILTETLSKMDRESYIARQRRIK